MRRGLNDDRKKNEKKMDVMMTDKIIIYGTDT